MVQNIVQNQALFLPSGRLDPAGRERKTESLKTMSIQSRWMQHLSMIRCSMTLVALYLAACGGDAESSASTASGGGGQLGGNTSQASPTGGATLGGGSSTGGRPAGSGGTASSSSCDPAVIATGLPADTDCPQVVSCAQTRCATNAELCYGTGYTSGNYANGQCQPYVTCIAGCDCEATCASNCASQRDQQCTTCIDTLTQCTSQMCLAEALACALAGAGGAGGGSTSSYTCAELLACCARLSGTPATNCQTAYAYASALGNTYCNLAWGYLGC
jgi:hypothetical protein